MRTKLFDLVRLERPLVEKPILVSSFLNCCFRIGVTEIPDPRAAVSPHLQILATSCAPLCYTEAFLVAQNIEKVNLWAKQHGHPDPYPLTQAGSHAQESPSPSYL